MSSRIEMPLGTVTAIGEANQRDGKDRLVGEQTIYGPLSCEDVRMYLGRSMLEHLLEVAKSSMMSRAELTGVGARIKIWEASTGHKYTTWELISNPPRPESAPIGLSGPSGKG